MDLDTDLFYSERFCLYRNVAAVIGTLILLRFSLRLLSNLCAWIRAYFLAPWGIGRTNLKKYGPWAIVTGGSEGIGRGYALELARQGLNVVLMSRSQEKLERVANEIKEKYGREVRVLPTDFSRGEEIYPEIAEKVKDLDIGILGYVYESKFCEFIRDVVKKKKFATIYFPNWLINNVGLSSEYPDIFTNTPIDRMHKMVEINIQSMVHMCHLFMPKMVEKKRGIVINLSSGGSIRPFVMLNVYTSSKAFVDFFTKGLSLEYSGKGIIIQTVAPLMVATAMSGIRRSNMMVADAVQYGRSAVATIGIQSYTQGCLSHAIQAVIFRHLPQTIFINGMWKAQKSDKAKYLKRKAKGK